MNNSSRIFLVAITLLLLFIPSECNGQIRYGSIEYEIKVNLEKRFAATQQNIGRGGRSRFNSNQNKYLTEKAILYFTDSLSVFVTEELENVNDQQRTFVTITKINLNKKTLETYVSLLGDNFIINDTLPKRIWKSTNKIRNIAGIDCQQAVTQINDSTKIYAWFNPEVVPAVGPESYWDLPGAIMGLAYEDGSVTYFATKINTDFPKEITEIKLPNARRKYTRISFDAEFMEKYSGNSRYTQLIRDLLNFY